MIHPFTPTYVLRGQDNFMAIVYVVAQLRLGICLRAHKGNRTKRPRLNCTLAT